MLGGSLGPDPEIGPQLFVFKKILRPPLPRHQGDQNPRQERPEHGDEGGVLEGERGLREAGAMARRLLAQPVRLGRDPAPFGGEGVVEEDVEGDILRGRDRLPDPLARTASYILQPAAWPRCWWLCAGRTASAGKPAAEPS